MSYKRFMTIKRGTMDDTLKCVFPWERPILEEIHGGNAQLVTLEQLCSMEGAMSVKKIPLPYAKDVPAGQKKEEAGSLRQQYESMCKVDKESDPAFDPATEYERMFNVYGMHPTINLSVVDKVYGSGRNFMSIVRQFRGTTPPANEAELLGYGSDDEDAGADEETAISDMGRAALVQKLDNEGIAYPKNAGVERLREIATTAAL